MERTQVAVVGAGAAGAAAAVHAARAGLDVALIDEQPVDAELMAIDIPLFYGQRALGTVSDRGLMLGRVVNANPGMQRAAEAGVTVWPGVVVWDSAANNTLTLADEHRSWRLRYDRAIFASGARDLCLPFAGWNKAGVMGAAAALSLIGTYQAFAGRRIAVLGSGDLAFTLARAALAAGVEVAGLVDVAGAVRGASGLPQATDAGTVPLFLNHTLVEALGDEEVEGLAIAELDGSGAPIASSRTELRCDTVCFAIGMVSNVDVLYWTGCELVMRPQGGELVPSVDANMRTTRREVFAAGDCAGFSEGSFATPGAAAAQGVAAASAAARDLGIESGGGAPPRPTPPPPAGAPDGGLAYRQAWYRSMSRGDPALQVCLCEEVTRAEVVGTVRHGVATPDHVKRLTRAGMGYCQGRRCREGLQMLVAEAVGTDVHEVPPATYRPPFRPVPLDVVRNRDLTDEEREFVKVRWHRRKPTTGGRSVEAE